jgi:hypothetical protein
MLRRRFESCLAHHLLKLRNLALPVESLTNQSELGLSLTFHLELIQGFSAPPSDPALHSFHSKGSANSHSCRLVALWHSW